MSFSILELHSGFINIIPEQAGIYYVEIPSGFELIVMNETDGLKKVGKKKPFKVYYKEDMEHWLVQYKINSKNKILYVGKADNLKKRLEEYINFGYGVETHHFHSGGRAIWYLKNNKSLLISYELCDNPPKKEAEQIDRHILKYGEKPFANRVRGLKKYRLF